MQQQMEKETEKVFEIVSSQVKKYKVKIQGISPLILDTRQRNLDLEKKELKKNELDDWDQKNWNRKAETDSKGDVRIPNRWLRQTFITACKTTRKVPHFAVRKGETYTRYAEAMGFNNSSFKCSPKKLQAWGTYVTIGGKSQIYCIRPMLEKWETEFEITDSFGRMKEKELRELLEYAGALLGIGTARKLNYGRFEVVSIKEIK